MAEKGRNIKTQKRFIVTQTNNSKSRKIIKKIEGSEKERKISVQKEIKFKRNELAKKLCGAWSLFPCILTIVILALQNGSYVAGEGNVGCLYVGSLCLHGSEFCYDDLVFGKCLSKSGFEMDDIDRTPVTEEQSRILATMLEELQGADLGWDHPFVQCQIQGTLFAMRRRTQLPPNLCANLAPDPEIIGPQSPLAFVRFTSPGNDEGYGDEVNNQPFDKDLDFASYYGLFPQAQRRKVDNMELLTELARRPDILPEEQKRIIKQSLTKTDRINHVKHINNNLDIRKILLHFENGELAPFISSNNYVRPHTNTSHERQIYDNLIHQRNSNKRSNNGINYTFFREVSHNKQIPLNTKSILMPPSLEYYNYPKKSKPFKLNSHSDEIDLSSTLFKLRPDKQEHFENFGIDQMGVYTEGGFLIPSDQSNKKDHKKDARTLLANMLGFTRHERLDVKKPGPLIRSASDIKILGGADNLNQKKTNTKEDMALSTIKREQTKKAKKIIRDHSAEDHAQYSVDTEYAFVIMKHPIDSWADGVRIVNALANTLQMNFTHPRVDSHEVSFRVEPNPDKKSADDVAKSINADRFKSNIYRRFGITIVRSGVGNKVKYDPENEVVQASKIGQAEHGPDVTHIMAYMFAGAGAAAALVIIVVLFLIRRHDKNRYKLGGLQCSNTGSESCSKDYQELCRARMATKGQSQDIPTSSGRISTLAKDNERPPSSRSSTSSWSEEPALTNMDISTGHMVLSYMEDHLRNKGRLQREWEALCRYEAEPSAREAALQKECVTLNRPKAPLPYDHSRVVLNHLANAEGLDYINASTITDHDPRAPAYVAAQGPLPTTLAHFWQMIWEQGAVVIVALCRLQENNEQVCARYWPEEGAEVYHIYEVHLVSEHIWCDDYLVRSFYLKNLRTSETRTVTQFHFLSWPQGGVPSQAKALLEFRRKVNKSYRGRSCPIVVHDSNGAGRTGAYILLDLVLGRMNKGAREIDIAATLEHLRDQRAGLVATRQQFEFVLMAVAEEVHAILKALPTNQNEKRDLDKEAVKEEDEANKRGKKKSEKSNDLKEFSNTKPENLKNEEK